MAMNGLLPEGHYADCANGQRIHYLDEGPASAEVAERMQIMQIMNGQVMATMTVPVLTGRLKEIDCPVLGFWGMNEKMMPENGIMALAQNIPHLRLILVGECGHWVMVEHEDMFNRACLDFISNG